MAEKIKWEHVWEWKLWKTVGVLLLSVTSHILSKEDINCKSFWGYLSLSYFRYQVNIVLHVIRKHHIEFKVCIYCARLYNRHYARDMMNILILISYNQPLRLMPLSIRMRVVLCLKIRCSRAVCITESYQLTDMWCWASYSVSVSHRFLIRMVGESKLYSLW